VRLDSGVVAGSEIGGAFDSLLAKVIVTGTTRRQALERSRRALGEFVVDGLPTVIPFHRAVLDEPAFAPELMAAAGASGSAAGSGSSGFAVHTRWIETEFDNRLEAWTGIPEAGTAEARERIVVEVGGKRLEVVLPAGLGELGTVGRPAEGTRRAPRRGGARKSGPTVSGDALTTPMQGTIVKVAVEEGAGVGKGDLVVVLEAMKMEQPILAHKSGKVSALTAVVGETVTNGAVLCEIKD
jgi:acetyl-CoA/propionyl-CoA carboxylase biotin carboxyl carrier protein